MQPACLDDCASRLENTASYGKSFLVGSLNSNRARQMEHSVGLADSLVNRWIERRISNPEGTDRQAGIASGKIAKRTVRKIIDHGYPAVAGKQQINQCRSDKACAASNQDMCAWAEFNHVRAMVVQVSTLQNDPRPRNTRDSLPIQPRTRRTTRFSIGPTWAGRVFRRSSTSSTNKHTSQVGAITQPLRLIKEQH